MVFLHHEEEDEKLRGVLGQKGVNSLHEVNMLCVHENSRFHQILNSVPCIFIIILS